MRIWKLLPLAFLQGGHTTLQLSVQLQRPFPCSQTSEPWISKCIAEAGRNWNVVEHPTSPSWACMSHWVPPGYAAMPLLFSLGLKRQAPLKETKNCPPRWPPTSFLTDPSLRESMRHEVPVRTPSGQVELKGGSTILFFSCLYYWGLASISR